MVSLGKETKLSKRTCKKSILTALLIMVAFDTFVWYSIIAAACPDFSPVNGFFVPRLYIANQLFSGFSKQYFHLIFVILVQIFSLIIFGTAEQEQFSLWHVAVFS